MPPIMAVMQDIRQSLGTLWRIAYDTAVLARASAPHSTGAVCIVQLGAIGDFVLWLDAGRRLARHYRAARTSSTPKLVLLANAAWAPWAREMDLADEVWDLDIARFDRDFGYRARWLRSVRAGGFDAVLQPTHSRTAAAGDSLVRASAAPLRIGSAGDCTNMPAWLKYWADTWFTRLIACGTESRMELLRNADFMRALGFADFRAQCPRLDGAVATAPPARYAVLAPGAGWAGRAWPASAFADIGRRLAARGLGLVLVGGAADRAAADAVNQSLPGDARDLVGRTSLAELATVLRCAEVVVANETSAAHIASAVGVPVVCVLGGGHYGRFMPYELEESEHRTTLPIVISQKMDCFGCNWHCIYAREPDGPVKCVREITPDAVWRQVEACLARGGSPR